VQTRHIGKSIPRKEAREKVTGRAQYVDDLNFPGMLYGATVRSPSPRGRIREIRFQGDISWNEFTIVTAKDIPGRNCISLLIDDQPCLADGAVNHCEEPVILLAHPDKYLLEEARRSVRIDVEPLPAVFSLEDSLSRRQIIWGSDNVFKKFHVEKGNVDEVWNTADFVIEGQYETGAQEQLYIEPQGMIAQWSDADGVTVWGSLQCPYYVHKALVVLFGLPKDRIRVIQAETGGGFGGKEEYPSMIAAHAALLARKSGRPVKIIYDRAEDMAATTKRHPSSTRHRTAVSRDGKLLAMQIDFTIDGGAYQTLSPVVLSRGTIHAAGPYACENVRIDSRAVATNAPPHGAFRGFGAPQSVFALERHLDRVADAIGLPPDELRRRNFIAPGQTLAVGQVVKEKVDLHALMHRAFELSDYYSKRKRFTQQNPQSAVKRGIGFASFLHGAGFTGSGEEYLASEVAMEALRDGSVHVLAGSTEMGQGTNTIFSQIAADALNLDCDCIKIMRPDTACVPNSGPTVASRTSMIVGKLVESAALALKKALLDSGILNPVYSASDFAAACARYIDAHGSLKSFIKYEHPRDLHWDDQLYRGDAYGAYAWAVYVAEVSVDTRTAEVRVTDFVAVQEVGKVINPALAAGQIEGGVAQGIGFALYENVVWQEGRMANAQMTNYVMPTSMDLPPIRVYFEEIPYQRGPAGAKGIGELPLDGTAPAIANAIAHATGADVRQLPVTPEVLLEMLESHGSTPATVPATPAVNGAAQRQSPGMASAPALSQPAAQPQTTPNAPREASIQCEVNGQPLTLQAYPMARLLDVLREQLKLTGTKEGCGEGECGACCIEIDGALVNSCLIPAIQAEGAKIRTIEGVAGSGALHGVQQAFITHGGAQCGICTPGMVLAAVNLLARCPHPDDAQIREGLSGNLCRCTGYTKIFEAVLTAVQQSGETAACPGTPA
jgi:CO/xanthine dehydrogenase Mo-binding subunit/aerobic-type carbon monoxide dehydrogenase small subunit (CoxS/CutS family)